MPVPPARRRRAEAAHDKLRADLLAGRWSAGTLLSAYALSEELHMSRTPVGEALKRLDAEGLVEIVPQVGCRVIGRGPQDVAELATILGVLEGLAAERVAGDVSADDREELEVLLVRLGRAARAGDATRWAELDLQLRDRILKASGSEHLARIVISVRATSEAVVGHDGGSPAARGLRAGVKRLQAVVDALLAGDGAVARDTLERHVTTVVSPAAARVPAVSDSTTAADAASGH